MPDIVTSLDNTIKMLKSVREKCDEQSKPEAIVTCQKFYDTKINELEKKSKKHLIK